MIGGIAINLDPSQLFIRRSVPTFLFFKDIHVGFCLGIQLVRKINVAIVASALMILIPDNIFIRICVCPCDCFQSCFEVPVSQSD